MKKRVVHEVLSGTGHQGTEYRITVTADVSIVELCNMTGDELRAFFCPQATIDHIRGNLVASIPK